MPSSTKYSYLDVSQRSEYQKRWYYLKNMVDKWYDRMKHLPGDPVPVFGNKKTLEQEIIDLEDVSLSAYRAMKCLRAQLKEATERDEEYYANQQLVNMNRKLYCAHCVNHLTNGWFQLYGKYFCDTRCADAWERDYEPESYAG